MLAAGDDGHARSAVGDRVLGTYCTACGECFFCRRGDFHKCDDGRVFGHGATLGSLQGAQAELLLVPNADLTLRKVPEGISDDVALFAGDVMGTGYHAVVETGARAGRQPSRCSGLGPVGLCAVQAAKAAGAETVIAIDTVDERLRDGRVVRRRPPVHLTEDDPRAAVKAATEGAGVDAPVDAVGHPDALDLACRIDPQGGDRLGDRRLRRADRAAHGDRLDQGADPEDRPRERDQARRPGARAARAPASSTRRRWSPTA